MRSRNLAEWALCGRSGRPLQELMPQWKVDVKQLVTIHRRFESTKNDRAKYRRHGLVYGTRDLLNLVWEATDIDLCGHISAVIHKSREVFAPANFTLPLYNREVEANPDRVNIERKKTEQLSWRDRNKLKRFIVDKDISAAFLYIFLQILNWLKT